MQKKNVKLQHMAPLHIQKYVHILRCLYQVVRSCFGIILAPEFETHIHKFKEIYLDLNIAITPKVHILTEHVPDFCKKNMATLWAGIPKRHYRVVIMTF